MKNLNLDLTLLEKLVIDKVFSVSTASELIYLRGLVFNDYSEHHDNLVNIMNEFKNKKQTG